MVNGNESMVYTNESGHTTVPCWLCGNLVPVKFTRKHWPYVVCIGCNSQTFIRGDSGTKLLLEKIKEGVVKS